MEHSETGNDHPSPVTFLDSIRLAVTVFPILFFTLFANILIFEISEDWTDNRFSLLVVSFIIFSVNAIGAISIIYKIFIDVVAIGIYRGNNPDETRNPIITVDEELLYSDSHIECIKCFQMLRVPANYEGRIKCTSCGYVFSKVTSQLASNPEFPL